MATSLAGTASRHGFQDGESAEWGLAPKLSLGLLVGVFALALRSILFNSSWWSKLRASGISRASVRQAASVLGTMALFMLVGPALITLNKHIMQVLHFPYPLSLSGLGVLTSAVVSHLCVAVGLATVRPESRAVVSGNNWFFTALPIGACKACTLATGNAAYLYLGLGFIQMLKAFTPAVVLAVTWALNRWCSLNAAKPSRSAMWFVYVMVAGTMVEVKGELNATALGLLLMTVSEVAEAVCVVLTQTLLQNCKFTVMEGLYLTAPPSCFFLFSVAAYLEWPHMISNNHLEVITANLFHFVAAGLLGLSVNFVSMLLMQVTSAVFCKILNTVRCIGLVVLGVLFYGEHCSLTEAAGYSVALLGFVGYNYVQIYPAQGSSLERRVDSCFCTPASFLEVGGVTPSKCDEGD